MDCPLGMHTLSTRTQGINCQGNATLPAELNLISLVHTVLLQCRVELRFGGGPSLPTLSLAEPQDSLKDSPPCLGQVLTQ
jgi:hypothetical protein